MINIASTWDVILYPFLGLKMEISPTRDIAPPNEMGADAFRWPEFGHFSAQTFQGLIFATPIIF